MAKAKRSYGKGKQNRKHFRFTDQVAGMLQQHSEELQQSENELVADAIFSYLSDRKGFIVCPTCDAYIQRKEKISVWEGVMEAECTKCKTQVWVDLDTMKIVKKKVHEAEG